MNELYKTLRDHAASDHVRLCQGREYSCDCGYDTKTEGLLEIAAARIEALEKICDIYAENNQRFYDRIEALEAALREIKDCLLSPDQSSAIAKAALEQEQDK